MSEIGNFQVDQLVWAKMKGFSPWPARIVEPIPELKRQPKKNIPSQCIFFFGSLNYAWIEDCNLKPYEEYKSRLIKSSKTAAFKEACEQIEEYKRDPANFNKKIEEVIAQSQQPNEQPQQRDIDEEFNKLRENDSSLDESGEVLPPEEIVTPVVKKLVKKKTTSERPSSKSRSLINKTTNNDEPDTTPPTKRKRRNTDNNISADIQPEDFEMNDFSIPRRNPASRLLNRPVIPPGRPDSPDLDLESVSQTLQTKNIVPSTLTFGFLGLGIMGRGIVKNLLNSGHKVIVWNRTLSKTRKFEVAGAEVRKTPMDVVDASDITFSCISDPKAVKDMVFGNCGVLQCSSFVNKGYVEMTGIDSETSQDIADAVSAKNGQYLEAQIQGSKYEAEEGTLIILAAGERTLFGNCQSCFEAMGKNSFYLGDIGNASKMNLVLQTISAVTVAALGEALALADRAGLQIKDVMEVISLTNMSSPLIRDKGTLIVRNDFGTQQPLQHLQKDLRLALEMADSLDQPLPLTSSCNEIFKTAKRQGYGDHDSSALYIRSNPHSDDHPSPLISQENYI